MAVTDSTRKSHSGFKILVPVFHPAACSGQGHSRAWAYPRHHRAEARGTFRMPAHHWTHSRTPTSHTTDKLEMLPHLCVVLDIGRKHTQLPLNFVQFKVMLPITSLKAFLTMSFFCLDRYGSVIWGSSWSSFISSEAALARCPAEGHTQGVTLAQKQP